MNLLLKGGVASGGEGLGLIWGGRDDDGYTEVKIFYFYFYFYFYFFLTYEKKVF